jgi:hypothetical protein
VEEPFPRISNRIMRMWMGKGISRRFFLRKETEGNFLQWSEQNGLSLEIRLISKLFGNCSDWHNSATSDRLEPPLQDLGLGKPSHLPSLANLFLNQDFSSNFIVQDQKPVDHRTPQPRAHFSYLRPAFPRGTIPFIQGGRGLY